LAVIAATRTSLRAKGETIYPVAPLDTLASATAPTLEETGKSPAVRLFRERASSVAPDFQLTDGNCHAVLAICRKLAGLPLAIELAAARSNLLSAAAMANRLERRLPNSRRGSPGQLEQQQTMRAAVAWSYDLLTPGEQSMLRHTSVLSGWSSVGEAMACTGSTEESNRQLATELLSSLARKSLLELSAIDGNLRYRLPEVVRECARELLSANDEEPQARRRPER
jgi:predicted ATPase